MGCKQWTHKSIEKISFVTHKCITLKSVNIRSLKHETAALMERIALGESVEIRRRNQRIAVLKPVEKAEKAKHRPDFRARLQAIYGDRGLSKTATELLSEERGDR